mmetsp:Transcript_33667/g.72817  ORF Transcript_33667/g.72817 Transcript_33667/m.72817 type:complete len:361 (+) Transcript_33667:148-1230(+)
MGKKRKNRGDRIDEALPPDQKAAKMLALSERKAEEKDWAAAEKVAQQAVLQAKEFLSTCPPPQEGSDSGMLLGKVNLQLGLVKLSLAKFAQARKPIEVAQQVAEGSGDHWFRAQVYGAQADLCYLQKRKNNGMSEEAQKFRKLQEKEEEKARQKDQQLASSSTKVGPGGPAYEPVPAPAPGLGPFGGRPPHPHALPHHGGGGMMRPPMMHPRPMMGMGPPMMYRPPMPPMMGGMMRPPMPPYGGGGGGGYGMPMRMPVPRPGAPAGMPPVNLNPSSSSASAAAAAPAAGVAGAGAPGQSQSHPPAAAQGTAKAAPATLQSNPVKANPAASKATSEMIWKEEVTSMEERRAELHYKKLASP